MTEASFTSTPLRRFRFGLRTLFVVVTVVAMVCAWVVYSLNWIRERQAFLNKVSPWDSRHRFHVDDSYFDAPAGLWLFGEKGVRMISFQDDEDRDAIDRCRHLFPEAMVNGRQPRNSRH